MLFITVDRPECAGGTLFPPPSSGQLMMAFFEGEEVCSHLVLLAKSVCPLGHHLSAIISLSSFSGAVINCRLFPPLPPLATHYYFILFSFSLYHRTFKRFCHFHHTFFPPVRLSIFCAVLCCADKTVGECCCRCRRCTRR